MAEFSADFQKLVAKKDATTTAAVQAFQRRMEGVVSRLDARIAELMKEWQVGNPTRPFDLEFSLWSRSQLDQALTDSGYFEAVGGFMGDYKDVIEGIVAQYRFFDHDLKLSPTNADIIKQLQEFDINYFRNLGTQTTEALYRTLYENTLVPVDFSVLQQAVSGTLAGSPLQKYSYTYANDTIMRFERSVNAITADATGWDKVRYVGPIDAVTRPFCQHHAGKTYTKDEAQAMKNDFGRSAWIEGGGYNCRHSWVAVPK